MAAEPAIRFRSPQQVLSGYSGPPIMRMAHPLVFASLLDKIGAPTERHMLASGLPVYARNPNDYVKVFNAWKFFDSVAQAEDEDFGWYVGQYAGESGLHKGLRQRIDFAPTLYQGLHELVTLVRSEASDIVLGIEERNEDILFYTHYPSCREMPGYFSSQAYQLPVYLQVIRDYLGANWDPPEIGIEAKDVTIGAKLCFSTSRICTEQERGYIVVPREALSKPPQRARGSRQAAGLQPTHKLSFEDRLRILLRPYVAEGIPSKHLAAQLMDVSSRTLTRRLSKSGLTYRKLLNELMFHEAGHMLRNSPMSIRVIAQRLGYDDQAHFSRAFRRIGGISPTEYRRLDTTL